MVNAGSVSPSGALPEAGRAGSGSPEVVVLTPGQSDAEWLEFRDENGVFLGMLYRQSGLNLYYSAEEYAEMLARREAAASKPLFRDVISRAQSLLKGGK